MALLPDKINGKIVSINGERYVYYKRLETDGYSALYQKAYTDTLVPRVEDGSNAHNIATYFAKLRDAEYRKEVELLSKQFGTTISQTYTFENNNAGEQLIQAFNQIYSTKEMFNYHLSLIQDTEGQKGVITYFPGYLGEQWEINRHALDEEITRILNQHPDDCDGYILDTLQKFMQDLVYKTLIHIYEDTENQNGVKNNPWIVQRPYQELADNLRKQRDKANIFVNDMIEIYGLNDFVEQLGHDIIKSKQATPALKNITEKNDYFKKSFTKGGLAKEVEAWFTAAMQGISGKRQGNLPGKPDITYTVNIDPNMVYDAYKEVPLFAKRSVYVSRAKEIQQKLKNIDDGFLIYTNQKDYTLNDKFKGYPADTNIPLRTWDDMLSMMSIKSNSLIFSVMQTIPGAIGESNEEEISSMFARAIAGALFDDFDISGHVQKTGAKTIHLLNLNGIYIPMSFYYDKLYEAFEYASINSRSLVQVTIKTPKSIQFPYVYPYEGGTEDTNESFWREANPGESPWRYQSDIALDEINISFHFFQGFKKIMENIGYIV